MHRGYFKVWRKQEDSAFWSMGAVYIGIWMAILHRANHKEGWFRGEKVDPGSFVCGVESLADELKLTRQVLRTALKRFEEWGQISTNNLTNLGTKIKVCNWDLYNSKEIEFNQPSNQPITSHQPADNQPITTIKECKNVRMKELRVYGTFVPPTVEEVAQYCQERKNGIDPQRFVDSYQAKGWMIGKNKVKDWKACVRTWERNEPTPSQPQRQQSFWEKVESHTP